MTERTSRGNLTFPQQAARASLWAAILAFGLSILTTAGRSAPLNRGVAIVIGLTCAGMMVLGLILAVYALFSMIARGRKGILGYAIAGLILNAVFLLLLTAGFLAARHHAHLRLPMTEAELRALPAVYPDATPVINAKFGFKIEIPPGFESVDVPSGKQLESLCTFRHNLPDGDVLVIQIQPMGGTIGPIGDLSDDHHKAIILKQLPPGSTMTLEPIRWNNYQLELMVAHMSISDVPMESVGVQVPLMHEAIQVFVGGPAGHVDESRAVMNRLLQSLKGRSNWDFDPAAGTKRVTP